MIFNAGYIDKVRNIANTDLAALYSFQELTGDMVDLSKNGNNVTPNGATQNGGRFKNGAPCYSFDGVNDWCDIDAAGGEITNLDVATVMVWFQITDINVWTDGLDRDLLWFFVDTNNNFFIEKEDTDDTLRVALELGNDRKEISTTSYADTNWHCLIARWDATGATKYFESFIDGVSIGTNPTTASATAGSLDTNSIGSFRNGLQDFWAGNIGAIAFWNKFLTDVEIEVLSKI